MRIIVTNPRGRDYKSFAKETPDLKKKVQSEKSKAQKAPKNVEDVLANNTVQELEIAKPKKNRKYTRKKRKASSRSKTVSQEKEVTDGEKKDSYEKGQEIQE